MKADLRSSGFSVEVAKATARKLLDLVRGLEVGKRGSDADDEHSI